MVVIFAGCDCTGKSSCFNLMDKSIWRLEKGVANSDLHETMMDLEMSLKINQNVIHDRNPLIDDIVYSQVFSKKPSSFLSELDKIKQILSRCVVIYFDCDNDIIAERMEKRGDEYVTPDQIVEIKNEYVKALRLLDVKPYIVNTSHHTQVEVHQIVKGVIKSAAKK